MMFKECICCGSWVDDGGFIGNTFYWIGIICGCDDMPQERYKNIRHILENSTGETKTHIYGRDLKGLPAVLTKGAIG